MGFSLSKTLKKAEKATKKAFKQTVTVLGDDTYVDQAERDEKRKQDQRTALYGTEVGSGMDMPDKDDPKRMAAIKKRAARKGVTKQGARTTALTKGSSLG